MLNEEYASGLDVLSHGPDLRPRRADVESVNKQLVGVEFGLVNPESHNHLCSSEDTFLQSFVIHLGRPTSPSAAGTHL